MKSRPVIKTATCPHCGRADAPLSEDGYIDRHRHASWVVNVSPGNEVCYGGGSWLKPGDSCSHAHLPNPDCASYTAVPDTQGGHA